MFEKATKTVRDMSESVREQGEIAGMRVQKSVIEKRLQESYAMIGKRYVEYVEKGDSSEPFDVNDVIEAMQPDMDKVAEIEAALEEKEINAKKAEEERREKRALEAYEEDKEKLDRALEMDVVTVEEYNEKMNVVQRKYDNREKLRKIEMQLQMDIITRDEYEAKVAAIVEGE